jgi:hypothetical protein
VYTDLIIAEIQRAINKLGGSAQPATPDEAQRALRDHSWGDTLPDEEILHLLKNWNAGTPLFQTIYAATPEDDEPKGA